jgi:quercetin dioxygenase-like cupin family protein
LQTESARLYPGLSLTLVTPDLTWRGGRSILSHPNCKPPSTQPTNQGAQMLKRIEVYKDGKFNDLAMAKMLVHDSPYFRVLNFNFKAGQELPIHSHDTDGQLSIVVLEGKGLFLGKDGQTLPARTGDVLISDISEPHGVRAESDMRVLVTIAPPL